MKPRFELHPEVTSDTPPPELMGSDSSEVTEQQFAASLKAKPREHRFIIDDDLDAGEGQIPDAATTRANSAEEDPASDGSTQSVDAVPASTQDAPSLGTNVSSAEDSWREELAAKMKQYRANKRPRTPRYPSLQLKFEALDSGATARVLPSMDDAAPIDDRVGDAGQTDFADAYPEPSRDEESFRAAPVASGKILEFPAPFAPPLPAMDELAEPILQQPRILEVPEVMPPPPALGGILIEPGEQPPRERRQGFELPLIAAPFSRRILAGAIDALIIAVGLALFTYTSLRMTSVLPSLRQAAGIAGGLLAVLWAGYQYLMLVHSGTTPGLKLAKLKLSRFDGSPVPLKLRRWRVLASLLSGLSLGLGYAWCFLDEDQLCWHDRITHTYMAPAKPE